MEKTYNPKDIEQPLYEQWEKQGYFKPNGDESQESFCIMNVGSHNNPYCKKEVLTELTTAILLKNYLHCAV